LAAGACRGGAGAAASRHHRAGGERIPRPAGAGARRWLDPRSRRQRGLSGRRQGAGEAVAMTGETGSKPAPVRAETDLLAAVRAAARQEQFLEVVSAEEARRRFERRLDLTPLPAERVTLSAA